MSVNMTTSTDYSSIYTSSAYSRYPVSKSTVAETEDTGEEAVKMREEPPKGPPPPKPKDVSEMSDDELTSILSQMQSSDIGFPSELSDYEDTDISSLTSEELDEIREIMQQMQEKIEAQKEEEKQEQMQQMQMQMMQNRQPMGPPPDISEMSDDDLKTMLSEMQSSNRGLPPELSDYEDTDISILTTEELTEIRELMQQSQERVGNNQRTSNFMKKAIEAYEQLLAETDTNENSLYSV